MEMLKSRSTLMAAMTLILGLALGVGISTWTSRGEAASGKAATSNSDSEPAITRSENWDPFGEMERMRDDIDRTIRRATEKFRLDSAISPFPRESGYSSSLDVRDRGDHFELRAYLPDAETKDVKVKSDGDRAVRVSVSHRRQQKKEENGAQATFSELGSYEQLVTLPEAVNANEMKVDTREDEVVITIPKAKAS